jgi:hypothetical protein
MKPWKSEPNHIDFEHAGFPCIMHRNPMGAWCGYVGVPSTHQYFKKHYDECDVSVHGGLTYANECQGDICHPGEDERWWLGFDCAHAYDLIPAWQDSSFRLAAAHKRDTYRDEAYVTAEVKKLAEQLAEK